MSARDQRISTYKDELLAINYQQIISEIQEKNQVNLVQIKKIIFRALLVAQKEKSEYTGKFASILSIIYDKDNIEQMISENYIDYLDEVTDFLFKATKTETNNLYM